MAISGLKDTAIVLVSFPMTPIHCVEAKSQVSFDWLMSSSKLQPCLKMCRFIQAFLKTKFAGWKAHFLVGISKKLVCNIHQNGWHITRGTQSERRVLCLESLYYNKSHPSPKLSASLRLMIESLPCLFQSPALFS
jgi:hypothetical protein